MNVVCAHFTKGENIGDAVSCPSLHFPLLGNEIDFSDIRGNEDVIIYGGGSMAEVAIPDAKKRKGIKIGWGIGYTSRGLLRPHEEPDYSVFDLIGSRDANGKTRWVPCASCMSTLFDEDYLITKDAVFYGHKQLSPMEALNNDCLDMERVIEHLASGETVVTSSYHGAYWATLLGRKVVAIPYGSKFFHYKHPPTLVDEYAGQPGMAYPEALHECREANRKMYEDVMNLIGG